MRNLPQNCVIDLECKNLLLEYIRNYIIYYYSDNKLFEQGFDIRFGANFLKIIYNKHHYFTTIVKINNTIYYYLKCPKTKPIILIASNPKIFNKIINLIKVHDYKINKKDN